MTEPTHSRDVVNTEPVDRSLVTFGNDDPEKVIERAEKVATAVARIIDKRKLYAVINGRRYVQVEGWTTMGAMLGVFPQAESAIEVLRDGKLVGYEAVSIANTAGGRVVGRAIMRCMMNERVAKNGEHAAMSMAQTRAVSKALRLCLSWVMVLAGYEPMPAEEMDSSPEAAPMPTPKMSVSAPPPEDVGRPPAPAGAEPDARRITEAQGRLLHARRGTVSMAKQVLKDYLLVNAVEYGIDPGQPKLTAQIRARDFDRILAWVEGTKAAPGVMA